LKILSGAISLDYGHIKKNGKEIKISNPIESRRLGISLVYQELQQVPDLSVAQNIFLGREQLHHSGITLDKSRMEAEASSVLARIGISLDVKLPVKFLGIAERQMVEIAKAILVKSDVIAFDEPTSTLSRLETEELFRVIRELRSQGVGIIYVSHRLNEISEIADRITILRDGSVVTSGSVSNFTENEIVKYMVGRDIEKIESALKGQIDGISSKFQKESSADTRSFRKEILRVESLSNDKIRNINFSLFEGEILGIAGLVGAGRTELVRAIYGADPYSGTIYLEGREVSIKSPRYAIKLGIGLIPEDRKGQAVLKIMPVRINLILSSLNLAQKFGIFLSKNRMNKAVIPIIENLQIRCPSLEIPIENLSGGNQQKVIVGRLLLAQSRILIFDEPTRGIDVGAKAEIYRLMKDLIGQGKSIIMVSSDLPEILLMSERILVMRGGQIVKELSRREASEEMIMLAETGGS